MNQVAAVLFVQKDVAGAGAEAEDSKRSGTSTRRPLCSHLMACE